MKPKDRLFQVFLSDADAKLAHRVIDKLEKEERKRNKDHSIRLKRSALVRRWVMRGIKSEAKRLGLA